MGKQLKSVCLFWETYWPNASHEGLGKEKYTTSFFSLPSYRQNLLPVSLDKENTSLWIRRTASAVLFWGFLIFYGCKQNPQRRAPGTNAASFLITWLWLLKVSELPGRKWGTDGRWPCQSSWKRALFTADCISPTRCNSTAYLPASGRAHLGNLGFVFKNNHYELSVASMMLK